MLHCLVHVVLSTWFAALVHIQSRSENSCVAVNLLAIFHVTVSIVVCTLFHLYCLKGSPSWMYRITGNAFVANNPIGSSEHF